MTVVPDPDDPIIALAAEVRDLAVAVAESTASVAAATTAAGKAADVARQVASEAVAAAQQTSRRRFALLGVALVIAGGLGYGGFDAYRSDVCERGNRTRAATVDAAGITVTATAIEVDVPPDEADALGARVRAEVAKDPRLQPKSC